MKTTIYSKAVLKEINAINENNHKPVNKAKKSNFELLAALLTLGAIFGLFLFLNHLGLIRKF